MGELAKIKESLEKLKSLQNSKNEKNPSAINSGNNNELGKENLDNLSSNKTKNQTKDKASFMKNLPKLNLPTYMNDNDLLKQNNSNNEKKKKKLLREIAENLKKNPEIVNGGIDKISALNEKLVINFFFLFFII